MPDDFGFFGKGLEGYAHYQAANDPQKKAGGGGGGKKDGNGFKIFLVIAAVYLLLKVFAWILY